MHDPFFSSFRAEMVYQDYFKTRNGKGPCARFVGFRQGRWRVSSRSLCRRCCRCRTTKP